MRQSAFLQIPLVIIFSRVKSWSWFDLGDNWFLETPALILLRFRLFGRGPLFRRMIKNHGTILVTNIRALTIERSWIVIGPKNF